LKGKHVQRYEAELKKILGDITSCETYFGEFSSLNDMKIDAKKMPIIYVDFLGEDPSNSFEVALEFSLYIAHAAYSKNENTRDIKRYEIYELLKDVNKTLYSKPILDSQPIKVKSSSKILDAKSSNAYITIFKKNIEFVIPQNHIQGSLIE
jgi:hypothetical protein